MKCPRCGSELSLDTHRKYNMQMCYNCGYMEGRTYEPENSVTNYEHLKKLNILEAAAFISEALNKSEEEVVEWLSAGKK